MLAKENSGKLLDDRASAESKALYTPEITGCLSEVWKMSNNNRARVSRSMNAKAIEMCDISMAEMLDEMARQYARDLLAEANKEANTEIAKMVQKGAL